MKKRDYIDTFTFSQNEMQFLVDLGIKIKESIRNGYYPQLLKNRNLGMIFEQTSTRTRNSAEAAMSELGGHALYLAPGQIQLGEGGHESLNDTGHVLGELLDIIGARVNRHEEVENLAKFSKVPVVNFMSDESHPTQALGDLITIEENLPKGKNLMDVKLVFVGDATQVAISTMFFCAQMGMEFAQFGPKTNQMPKDVLEHAKRIAQENGGSIEISDDEEVLKDADFIYTDVWYGLYDKELQIDKYMKIFYPKYQVNDQLLEKTGNKNVKFLHCLPASRGEEVSDSVLDGEHSLAWDQAGNRKTAMRAIFVYLLNPRIKMASDALKNKYKGELEEMLVNEPYRDNDDLSIKY